MNSTRQFRATVFLGFAIGAALLYLVISRVNTREALVHIRQVQPGYLAAALLLTFLNFAVRSWRWSLLFPPAVAPEVRSCYHINMVSLMANNLLPGRGGDILRCFLVSRSSPGPGMSVSVATLGVEKVLDGLTLVAVVFLSFLFWTPPQWVGRLAMVAAAAFLTALAVLFVLYHRTTFFAGHIQTLLTRLGMPRIGSRVAALCVQFSSGLESIASFRKLTVVSLLTLLIWVLDAAIVTFFAHALGAPLLLMQSALVSAIIGLGLMIPAAPGYVGTYEFFAVTTLSLLGVKAEKGLALALLLHAWTLLSTTGAGILSLSMLNLRLAQLFAPPADRSRQENYEEGVRPLS